MKNKIIQIFQSSLNKDILSSLVFRGLNILLSLILLPLSLKLLSADHYGVWLTVYALNTWVNLFDLGTQNTLRNKLASTIYHENKMRLRGLLITNSFAFSIILSIIIIALSSISFFLVDFTKLLRIKNDAGININILVYVCLLSFSIKLFVNNFNSILLALQKAYLTIFISTLSSLITVLILLYISYVKHGGVSVFDYGLIILVSDILISLFFPIIYLKCIGFKYGFSLRNFSFNFFKRHLFSSNIQFFLISILIVFTFFSDNFFIGILLNYKDVVAYNLVNKYFNIITMISIVALNPIWTQVSIFYLKKEILEIYALQKKMYMYFLCFIVLAVLLLFFDDFFYARFSSGKITIALKVSVTAALASLQLLFNNIHAYILNGMNKTGVQIFCLTVGAIAIIPLYFTLVKVFHTGILGSFLVQIIVFLPMTIFLPIYLRKYLRAEIQKA